MKKGLEDAGFEVNPGLWQFYEDNYKERSDQEGGNDRYVRSRSQYLRAVLR